MRSSLPLLRFSRRTGTRPGRPTASPSGRECPSERYISTSRAKRRSPWRLLERHIADTDHRLHEWVGHMVAEQHGLRAALHDYVTGMLEMHSGRPRLQHILLEETPLPERVHQAVLEAERRAAKTVAGLLRLYPEVRHANLEHAGFVVVQTVESLTHRFAAHPDEQFITRTGFVDEVVTMLVAYLTCEAHSKGVP